MIKEKSLSKKIRFLIFDRDEFTCQYCGQKPPSVILEVDHILPKIKSGKNEVENLITSCFDCNRGKSTLLLGSTTKQISENIIHIKEKKEQMEAFYKYQKTIDELVEDRVDKLSIIWSEVWNNKYSFNQRGRATIKLFLKFLPSSEIEEAIFIATNKIQNDVNKSFKYFCGILHNKRKNLYGQRKND